MSRKLFGQLLQKYLRGECSPAEREFVEHWYGLLETDARVTGEELDMAELENRLWSQIQRKMDTESANQQRRIIPLRTVRNRWLSIAACLLLIGFWYFFYLADHKQSEIISSVIHNQSDWIERTNASDQPSVIRLEDGSIVTLAAHSTLRFPQKFASENRTVFLTGDAFFDIHKMPSRPFYVKTGNIVTKVLGTRFSIWTQGDTKQVHVEVVTGRVAVYEETAQKQKEINGVVLTPNQATTFFSKEQHFVTSLVDKPVVIKSTDAEAKPVSFLFDDAPLLAVLEQLEQAYGIAIEVENEQQNNCPLTADLTNQTLYTQLDIICAALKSSYKIQGTTILISGKGCSD